MKFQGTVVNRPELSFTPTGRAVCNMTVEVYPDNEHIPVVTWNEVAEKVSQHIKPEDRIEFYGEKKTRWWTNEGEKISREEINAHRVKLIARQLRPDYCCLSCIHWEADCMTGCYNAFGSPQDRETCSIEENKCMNVNVETSQPMNRDCWEKL